MTLVEKNFLAIFILVSLIVGLTIGMQPVNARPAYAKDLPEPLKNYCILCHETAAGKGLNRFGLDYANNGFSVDAILALDSDEDGFTNGEELKANTFPGDPKSHPGAPMSRPGLAMILLIIVVLLAAVLFVWIRLRISKIFAIIES